MNAPKDTSLNREQLAVMSIEEIAAHFGIVFKDKRDDEDTDGYGVMLVTDDDIVHDDEVTEPMARPARHRRYAAEARL